MYYNTKNSKRSRMCLHTGGFFRVLHASPNAPDVDVYLNGKIIIKNLAYGKYSTYMPLCQGDYKLSIYKADTEENPILENTFTIGHDDILTITISNVPEKISFLLVPDADIPLEENKSMIRFMHLSPNAPAVDITLPDGTKLFERVSFQELTPYIEVDPATYTLQVRPAGTSDVVLTVPGIVVEPDKYYTIYALGLVNATPSLSALQIRDSNEYIDSRTT